MKNAAGTENNCINKAINDGMPATPSTKVDGGNCQDNFTEYPQKDSIKDHGTDSHSSLSSKTIHAQTEDTREVMPLQSSFFFLFLFLFQIVVSNDFV